MINKLGRFIPENFKPYMSSLINKHENQNKLDLVFSKNKEKLISSLQELFDKLNITNGMTLSFHHHLRNGDYVFNMVLDEIKARGLKDMILAPSAIFPNNDRLADLIENGNVVKIYTNYLNGKTADVITAGKMKDLLIMDTHGGRARAIMSGEIQIDVAFCATPSCDKYGNGNGVDGVSACGSLGYIIPDIMYAKNKVAITDNLVDKVDSIEIYGMYIDYVLKVDSIGDKNGIVSGTTKVTKDPVGLKIARDTSQILNELGMIKNGFSMQTGAGGISLAVTSEVKKIMLEKNIKASFASGGITSYFVDMLENNLIEELYDVQCFDLEAVRSIKQNKNHHSMSSSKYANPYDPEVIVDKLDFVILGATEIDLNFNVNVTTSSMGQIMGGSGGHSDAAHGAKVTVITTNLLKSRLPIIKEHVTTITTPGEDIDILVTERGIAINPKRVDLIEKLKNSKLNILTIEKLLQIAHSISGKPSSLKKKDKVVGVVRYRDGSIIDSLYEL